MTTKAEFLAEVALFAGMDEDELEALAEITREYEYPERAVVVYQRDVADRLYIVRTGRLEAYALDEQGNLQDSKVYMPADYFDDIWLFTAHTYPATIKTVVPSRLLVILGRDFLTFLEHNPHVLDKLMPSEPEEEGDVVSGLSASAWEEAQHSRVAPSARAFRSINILPDELILYQAHRSRWVLYWRILWPTLLLLALVIIFATLIAPRVELLTSLATELTFGLVLVSTLVVIGLRYLDWLNDYFVITTRHLIHHEFHLLAFRSNINKTPIDQVQSVEIEKPSLLSNLLGVGTARVTTAAQQGVIYFDFIDEPGVVTRTINQVRQQVQMLDAGREQATMRKAIEQHFHMPKPHKEVIEEETEEEMPASPTPKKSLRQKLRAFISSRQEENGVITFRKHYLVLLKHTWLPAALTIIPLAIAILLRNFAMVLTAGCGLSVVGFAWLVWSFEDWRNDTFQITDRYVIDIDRRPFGFGESRKQAQLSEIQNVKSDRPGLVATIFKFGFVYIETAGANANIVFENVMYPNQIQTEIFNRREQFHQRQRQSAAEQQHKEYAVLLDVYQQAIEQERIPNRTRPNQINEAADASPNPTPEQA